MSAAKPRADARAVTHAVARAARQGIAAAARPDGTGVNGRVLPRQSGRHPRYIARHPGPSTAQVHAALGIRHPSQVSNVLARLERDDLVRTERGRRPLHPRELTEHGGAVVAQMPEGIYE